jgi:hypothetical protein
MAGNFDLSKYAEVKDRIQEFYVEHPQGSIQTFLRHVEGPEVIFEARIFRNPEEVVNGVYTSGFAREVEGKSPVNRTSHLENSETSAIGRALANLNYQTTKERASRQEMLKVERQNREHDEMLSFIKEMFPSLTDDAEATIEGATVRLKAFIMENGRALPERMRLARVVVDAIETVTGTKMNEGAAA